MSVQQRRAREREDLRQEILDAARTLFVKNGFESVSIRKIADAIDYSPGTIYLYFRDKADIFSTLCEETFAKLSARLEAIELDSADPLDKLRRAGRTYVDFALHFPNHYLITFIQAEKSQVAPPDDDRLVRAGYATFRHLHEIVRQCRDAGLLRSDDLDEVSQALWAAVHGVSSLLITHCGFPFVEQTRLIDRVLDMALEGIRKP